MDTVPPNLPSSSGASPVKGLSLRRNISWTFLGNVVYAGSNFLTLAVLAKLGSKAMVGEYSLGVAITIPVINFCQLNLRSIQSTDVRGEFSFGDYLGLRLLMTLLSIAVVAGLCLTSSNSTEQNLVTALVMVGSVFDLLLGDVLYGHFQLHERMTRIALSRTLKGVVSLIALIVVMKATHNVVFGAISIAVSYGFVYVLYDLPGIAHASRDFEFSLAPHFDLHRLKRLAIQAIPMGITMMLAVLSLNLPRYDLESRFGPAVLGMFSAMAGLIGAGRSVADAVSFSASSRLARLHASGDRKRYLALVIKLALVNGSVGLASLLIALTLGRPLLAAIFRPEYGRNLTAFVIIVAAGSLTYVAALLGVAITSARQFKVQVWWLLAVVVTGYVASKLLVPTGGLTGAALALLAICSVQMLIGVALLIGILAKMPRITLTDAASGVVKIDSVSAES